jgi:hypothetical protein
MSQFKFLLVELEIIGFYVNSAILDFLYKSNRELSTVIHEDLSFFSTTEVYKNKIAVVKQLVSAKCNNSRMIM